MIFSISYTITAKKEEVAVLVKQQPPILSDDISVI